MNALNTFFFSYYPYICLAVFLLGSLLRFDRDQYTWKSDSSQLLRAGQLRLGSNLFHIGILFLFFGHAVGMLTPHFVYEPFISAGAKQVLAMVSGGCSGCWALSACHCCCTAACPIRVSAPPRAPATSCCCGCCGRSSRSGWRRYPSLPST